MTVHEQGSSDFEARFNLKPTADLEARVGRAEALIALFISAALEDGEASLAELWMGTFAPSQVTIPLPSAGAVNRALDGFRTDEFLEAQRCVEEDNFSMGMNPDGSNIQ